MLLQLLGGQVGRPATTRRCHCHSQGKPGSRACLPPTQQPNLLLLCRRVHRPWPQQSGAPACLHVHVLAALVGGDGKHVEVLEPAHLRVVLKYKQGCLVGSLRT